MAMTAAFVVIHIFVNLLPHVASERGASFMQAKSGLRVRAVALADVSAASSHAAAMLSERKHADVGEGPLPSGWFGDFSQGESTYNREGLGAKKSNPEFETKYGRDPSLEPPFPNTEIFNSEFFHESESGGPKAAWQTHYPSLETSIAGNHKKENSWTQTPSGWKQEYNPGSSEVGPGNAHWFDSQVGQIDGFGREMQPDTELGQRLTDWKERSVNTTITCKEINCTARASLQLSASWTK